MIARRKRLRRGAGGRDIRNRVAGGGKNSIIFSVLPQGGSIYARLASEGESGTFWKEMFRVGEQL